MHDIVGLAKLHGLSVKEEPGMHGKSFLYSLRTAINIYDYPSADAALTSTLHHHPPHCAPMLVAVNVLYHGGQSKKPGRLNTARYRLCMSLHTSQERPTMTGPTDRPRNRKDRLLLLRQF